MAVITATVDAMNTALKRQGINRRFPVVMTLGRTEDQAWIGIGDPDAARQEAPEGTVWPIYALRSGAFTDTDDAQERLAKARAAAVRQ